MSYDKYVVGSGALLDWALASWTEIAPEIKLHRVEITQDDDYRFELQALDSVSPDQATAFVVWSSQFLNFRRLELMGELKSRGFKLPSLICRGAIVSPTASLGENCSVGSGAVVESGCKIGFNSRIGASALIGTGTSLGSSTWVGDGVQIGAKVRIGANATVGSGVILDDELVLGRQCILDIHGRRSMPVADKTFITASFPRGVVVVDGGGATTYVETSI